MALSMVNYNSIPSMYSAMIKWNYQQWQDAGSSIWSAIDQAHTAVRITKNQYNALHDAHQKALAAEVDRRKKAGKQEQVIYKSDSDTLAAVKAAARNNAVEDLKPTMEQLYIDGYYKGSSDTKATVFKNVLGMGGGALGVGALVIGGLIAFSFIFKK